MSLHEERQEHRHDKEAAEDTENDQLVCLTHCAKGCSAGSLPVL